MVFLKKERLALTFRSQVLEIWHLLNQFIVRGKYSFNLRLNTIRDDKTKVLNSVGKTHSRALQKHGGPTGRKEAELLSIWFEYMLQQLDNPNNKNNPKII